MTLGLQFFSKEVLLVQEAAVPPVENVPLAHGVQVLPTKYVFVGHELTHWVPLLDK